MINAKHGFLVAAGVIGCSVSSVVYQPDPPPAGTSTQTVFNGDAVQAAVAPPPLAGGTVRIVKSGGAAFAVASDPDEDVIDVVGLGDQAVTQIALHPGDEPNRMVADASGRVHVVLRGGGAIATIDPATGTLISRRSVCLAPRGIDYDAKSDTLYVACATGELVALPSVGAVSKVMQLDRDLRDVVVTGDTLVVTRFRSAERLVVDANGTVLSRAVPGGSSNYTYSEMSADVAWRTLNDGTGKTVMLHQLASTSPLVVVPTQTYYAASGTPISASAVTVESAGNGSTVLDIEQAIDFTLDGTGKIEALSLTGVVQLGTSSSSYNDRVYLLGPNVPYSFDNKNEFIGIDDGAALGVPFKVVQRRAPSAALLVYGSSFTSQPTTIALPQKTSHIDTGFDVFHIPTSVGSACMNCHPEGGDDGHTWKFTIDGTVEARRTQSLRGGLVTDTAPYHWNGDLGTLRALCDEVFTHRMGGGHVDAQQEPILARWLNSIPRIPVRTDLDSQRVAAGKGIFEGSGGCTSCHVGGTGTLTENQDVGKVDVLGQANPLQVPSLLGVADRAPYMHDGCAPTLKDRFVNACGGSHHGNVDQLSADDLTSLTTYLESL